MSKLVKLDLLRHARDLIESGKQMYICCALESIIRNSDEKSVVFELTANIINVQLQIALFFESWLNRYRRDLPREIPDRRKYRLQWIDEMIRRLENDEEFVPLSSIADIFHV
jgi:hypothetical protein